MLLGVFLYLLARFFKKSKLRIFFFDFYILTIRFKGKLINMQKQIKLILIFSFLFGIFTADSQNNTKPFVVVLDAGHGGKDPGRPTDFGYKEKDIALKMVLKIGENLKKYKNIKVIYTRKTDVFLELRQRAAIANKADADLFVSIHCNAHSSNAYGTETYVLGLHRNESNFRVAQQENEVIFLEEDFEKILEIFPNGKIKTIPKVGHWLHAENPMEFYKIVKEFID